MAIVAVFFLCAGLSFAGEEKPKKSPLEELSKEEITERIRHMLEVTPEAVGFIQRLKVASDENGNVKSIEYETGGVYKNIDTLDKKTLIKIHNRINNERTRIQTERIQRQLQAARAGQNIPKQHQVHIPPSIPKPPAPPPAPPKVPTPPPAPPQIPRAPQR